MTNKQEYVDKYKLLYEAKTGKKISDQEALVCFEQLISLVGAVYQPIRDEFFKETLCRSCEKKIDFKEFTDEPSKREFMISGLCQVCQDKTFKKCRGEKSSSVKDAGKQGINN